MKIGSIATIATLSIATVIPSIAKEKTEKKEITRKLRETSEIRPVRKLLIRHLFHAKAQHQCWSKNYAGYWCDVEGRGYTDCNQAAIQLKLQPCCKDMYWNNQKLVDGAPIDFKMKFCTPLF